jgi:alcohol dehydrogenase
MKTRAAVLYSPDRPSPFALSTPLSIEELDLSEPGIDCVLVEVAAAGLCHSDLSVINGSRPRPTPMVLGHEAAGIVREVGANVRELAPGDHVVFSYVPACGKCLYCATGRPALCENGARTNLAGTLLDGKRYLTDHAGQSVHHHLGVSAFSQFAVAAAESLIRIERDLPLQTAALFGCAVLTGVGAVINTARVEPGSSVAVFGLGGVGLCAVMGAALAGAAMIVAVDPLRHKLEQARRLGATHTIQAGNDAVAEMRELSRGGVDYAIECTGIGSVMAASYESTRRGGTVVTVSLPAPTERFALPITNLVAEERTVKGSFMGSAVPKRDIPRMIALHRAGRLPVELLVSGSVRLEELNAAFDRLATGEATRQILRFER